MSVPAARFRFVVLAVFIVTSSWTDATAAPFDIPVHDDLTTLQAAAALADAYDIVFVGDGYTEAQRNEFLADAKAVSTGLLEFGPYADSRWLINSHALFAASKESGADHPGQEIDVDTAFDATYESFGIAYLITASTAKILTAVGSIMPAYDQVILIVNDDDYGGSGGEVSIVSTAPASLAILRHEVAHSIGGLADEYEHPNPNAKFEDPEPNVASVDHLTPLKWGHWLEPGTPIPTPLADATGDYAPVGAYEGARYLSKDMFRPSPECIMRSLDKLFCSVCGEVMILRLASESTMLRERSPTQTDVDCTLDQCPAFTVQVAPLADLRVRWLRDAEMVGEGLSWQPGVAALGDGQLIAEIRHESPRVRLDAKGVLIEEVTWQLNVRPNAVGSVDAGGNDVSVPGDPTLPMGCTGTITGPGTPAAGWGLLALALALLWRRRRWRQIR